MRGFNHAILLSTIDKNDTLGGGDYRKLMILKTEQQGTGRYLKFSISFLLSLYYII